MTTWQAPWSCPGKSEGSTGHSRKPDLRCAPPAISSGIKEGIT